MGWFQQSHCPYRFCQLQKEASSKTTFCSSFQRKNNTFAVLTSMLSPTSFMRIFWESSKFEGNTSMSDPWYGTAYSMEKVSGATIKHCIEHAPSEELHLPAPNVVIPTDLSLKLVFKKKKFPILLKKSPYSRLWYKPDTSFSSPKDYVMINFSCPYCGHVHSPEVEALAKIFTLY